MVNEQQGPGTSTDADRIPQASGPTQEAWEQTLEDMAAMARDREERGFETLQIPAGDTTPKSPAAGDTDRFGLSYVVPSDVAGQFQSYAETGSFTETAVYQVAEAGHVYIVTECVDVESGVVVFVAGTYQMRHAPALVRTATERGRMYTHLRTLDGTHLGTIEHEDVSAFFPEPEAFYAYEHDG